jgi:membrane protease YdiL (CAAX protease family)
VNDGPAWLAPPTAAEAAPPSQPSAPAVDPLRRYRALQIVSILLIVGGLVTTTLVVALNLELLLAAESLDPASLGRAIGVLAGVVVGGLAFVVGLVMNAVRAIIVRRALPPTRYRGPSIFVLLLISTIISSIGVVGATGDLIALQAGGELTVGGSLLLLTITQIGLVVTAGLFVVAPEALPGVRLLPERGGGRSILLGLLLAVPAWVGATTLGLILTRLLELLGRQPEPGIVDIAVARIDPTVLILALVLVAPVAEELFFRGVVLNAWTREYGTRAGIIGSAALFAAIHANLESFDSLIASVVTVVPILGLGIALALIYRGTRTLAAAMAMHAGFNAISVSIALLVRAGVLDIPLPT